MIREVFIGKDEKELALYLWEAENCKLVLQIVHGMAEHMARYDDFANYMNKKGITVAAVDLRCHGFTDPNTLGYCKGDTWEDSVSDEIMLSQHLKSRYGKPIVIFGHSYGSFLTQRLIETNDIPVAFILSGSCYMKSPEVGAGLIIAKIQRRLKGGESKAKLLYNMTFGSYNKQSGGNAAWLSRDKAQVDKYNADGMCGFCCSANFYYCFFKGLKAIYKKDNLANINKDKPLYIMSGAQDPVGKMSKGVTRLHRMYKDLGVKNLSIKLYEGGRHEMLNETNKLDVYQDIEAFLNTLI